jgi:hypothetical protein
MHLRPWLARAALIALASCRTSSSLNKEAPAPSADSEPPAATEQAPPSDTKQEPPSGTLPKLPEHGESYETPRAGQGFFTRIFGQKVVIWPEDRRSVSAWDLGAVHTPGATDLEWEPIAAVFLWRRPDDDNFLRAVVNGVYNEIEYAHSPDGWGPFEIVATLDNLIFPLPQSEYVDGEPNNREELVWGHVVPGIGLGYRIGVSPGKADNMFATSVTFEPGYFFADEGAKTAASFVQPANTFEERVHWRVRYDALERNLLELAHKGFAFGMDTIGAHRASWKDWGTNGEVSAKDGRDYLSWTGYARAATAVPGLNEQHRLLFGVHGGVGSDLDRFSAPRVGGDPQDDEYGALRDPVIPAALPNEFFPDHYAIATLEYRFEPIFFTYVGIEGSVAWLDRDRATITGIEREDGIMKSVGVRLTTGFVFETRLEAEANYNFDVVRDGHMGGYAVLFHVSRKF